MVTHGHQIAIDIETVVNERAIEWWDKAPIEAPKNYKDPEKVEAYIKAKKAEKYTKSALTWHTGKLFSFATVNVKDPTDIFFQHSLDEKRLLETIAVACSCMELWSKSGLDFDYGFIVGRMIVHGVKVPASFYKFQMCKDIDTYFGRRGCGQILSLEAYAHGLGIEGKFGDYKIVGETYDAVVTGTCTQEQVDKLEKYNVQDAAIVAEIVRRYNGY